MPIRDLSKTAVDALSEAQAGAASGWRLRSPSTTGVSYREDRPTISDAAYDALRQQRQCHDGQIGSDGRAHSGDRPVPASPRRSGTLNAGEAFELRATAAAEKAPMRASSGDPGAVRPPKLPFILADRYALLLLPKTLIVAGAAWLLSARPIRGQAVPVAATPCPLVSQLQPLIAGVSQTARWVLHQGRRSAGGAGAHSHRQCSTRQARSPSAAHAGCR